MCIKVSQPRGTLSPPPSARSFRRTSLRCRMCQSFSYQAECFLRLTPFFSPLFLLISHSLHPSNPPGIFCWIGRSCRGSHFLSTLYQSQPCVLNTVLRPCGEERMEKKCSGSPRPPPLWNEDTASVVLPGEPGASCSVRRTEGDDQPPLWVRHRGGLVKKTKQKGENLLNCNPSVLSESPIASPMLSSSRLQDLRGEFEAGVKPPSCFSTPNFRALVSNWK